jgi:hypothetical protein
MDVSERARRYLAATPPAVSGCGGDQTTHKVAFTLVKGFGLPPETAIVPMLEWNERCLPPWTHAQLMSKLRSASRAGLADGFLLGVPGTARISSAGNAVLRGDVRLFREESPRQPAPTNPAIAGSRVPSIGEQRRIAELRGLSPGIPILAANDGILRTGIWQSDPAYFLVGKGVTQARRLDGAPWKFRSGNEGKAWTIGPVDAFGIRFGLTTETERIIITEGLVSILEALEVLLRAEQQSPVLSQNAGLIAAYSAASRLTRREAQYLARRRVLIIADAGPAGLTAARAWRASIRHMGGRAVSALQFDEGDLGSALRESPRCPAQILEFLEP